MWTCWEFFKHPVAADTPTLVWTVVAGCRPMTYHPTVSMHSRLRIRYAIAARILTVMGVLAVGQACASRTETRSPFDGPSAGRSGTVEDPVVVEVRNLNFNDITVWTVRSGQRVRLGRVTGKTDETFRIGWNVAVPIRFDVDVIGGRSCAAGPVGVEPNAIVWLSIPSSVGVQPCRVGRR